MHTVFVSYSGHFGGAERILLDLAAGHDAPVAIICPEGALASRARDAGIEVLIVRERSLRLRGSMRETLAAAPRIAAQAAEVRRLLRGTSPRIIVGWNMRGGLVAAAARPRGARFVFQHNDLLPGPGVARAVRAMARRAGVVIALSQAIAADLGVPARVVHHGVDLDEFTPAERPAGAPPTAVVLGAIVPWKRPDLALEIASIARRARPDLRLVVAGAPLDATGDRLAEHLEGRAACDDLAGHVDLVGGLDDPREALRGASLLLHCSDAEPFGLALVEALACGVPVVAADGGGPREIVAPECGALYAPGDAAAGAAALIDTLERVAKGEPLRAEARKRAEAEFDLREARERWWAAAAGPGAT